MALGRIAVWPFFAIGLIALGLGATFVIAWWPDAPPAKESLVKVTGKIAAVVIRDDVSGSSAGALAAGLQSVYFTLAGHDGEFRYPALFPRYFEVRDRVAVEVDVWVDPAEQGMGRPLLVWQIQEHNPYNVIGPETFVPYEDIVVQVTRVDRSMVRAGTWILAIAPPFLVLGLLAVRWNRGKPLPMP